MDHCKTTRRKRKRQILGGMGGKFNGAKIEKGNKQGFKKLAENKPKSRREMLLEKRKQNNKLDFSLPEKIDSSVIIQNRNRGNIGSIKQVKEIAPNCNFDSKTSGKPTFIIQGYFL